MSLAAPLASLPSLICKSRPPLYLPIHWLISCAACRREWQRSTKSNLLFLVHMVLGFLWRQVWWMESKAAGSALCDMILHAWFSLVWHHREKLYVCISVLYSRRYCAAASDPACELDYRLEFRNFMGLPSVVPPAEFVADGESHVGI